MTDSTNKPATATPCPEREEALALHVGGDLPADEARELDEHLAGCAGCRAFLAELAADRRALEAFASRTEPVQPVAEVHRRVMAEVGTRSERRRSPSTWRWAAAAALLLALGAALLLQLLPGHSSPDPGTTGEEPTVLAEAPRAGDEEPVARAVTPTSPPATHRPPPETPETPETPSEGVAPNRPDAYEPKTVPESVIEPQPDNDNRRAGREERPDLKIQLVSDDPDIVIYWLVDMEEPADAASSTSST